MPGTELEKKLKEYEDLPAFILGLNGWLLGGIPEDRRKNFLEGYEKLIRTVYYPDHAKSAADKSQRERFIQAVAKAVGFLVDDPLAFQLAIDNLPTPANPVVKLQKARQEDIARVNALERRLTELAGQYTLLLKTKDGLEKRKALERLRAYDVLHREKSMVYDISVLENFDILGRGMVTGVKAKPTALFYDILREILPDYELIMHLSYEDSHNNFSKELEKSWLLDKREELKFRKGVARNNGEDIRVIGSMPLESLREYIRFYFTEADAFPAKTLKAENLNQQLRTLYFDSNKDKTPVGDYERRVLPFTTPYLILNNPALIKRTKTKDKKENIKFELFYVNGFRPDFLL
jgi:hypothetical protein